MYERIFIGVDFSEDSLAAVRWTASRFPEAELTLFHAVEPPAAPNYALRSLDGGEDLAREKEHDARANLEHARDECAPGARLEICPGWPPRELNRAAVAAGAELMVVAAHPVRAGPSDETGETCVAIVKKATIPVLVWRPTRRDRDHTILAAVDLREGSVPIAATAARFAEHFDTRLVLFHVLPSGLQPYVRAVSTPAKAEETQRSLEQAARLAALERLPEALRDSPRVHVRIGRGKPITGQIIEAAEHEAADLIVAGKNHAPAFTGRVLLGNITGKLVRWSASSVLVVPV
ncbi:MAG: universal stress protein [Gemmatimonadota bacterium]